MNEEYAVKEFRKDDEAKNVDDLWTLISTHEGGKEGGLMDRAKMSSFVKAAKQDKFSDRDIRTALSLAGYRMHENKIDKLMEKYRLNERNFETKEEFVDYLQNTLIPDLRASGRDGTAEDFEEALEWLQGGGEPAKEPVVPPSVKPGIDRSKEKFYNIDMNKLYKTGDVGESKIKELIEKYGLEESIIGKLLEKYGLSGKIHEAMVNGRKIIEQGQDELFKAPKDVEELDKTQVPEPGPDGAIPPEAGVEAPGPEGMNVSDDSEPAPLGGEPKAEDMATPESAESNLRMQYPEEPFTTTAMAYADSLIDEPKVYGAIRNLKWTGAYANSETFLKQAKIVGSYNEFNPDIAKRLVDAIGDGAKFRLAREGSVAVYFTIRDTDKKVSLETLKGIVRADEADPTGNPGEARLWWD